MWKKLINWIKTQYKGLFGCITEIVHEDGSTQWNFAADSDTTICLTQQFWYETEEDIEDEY